MKVKLGADWQDMGSGYGRVAPENATAADMADEAAIPKHLIRHMDGKHIALIIVDMRFAAYSERKRIRHDHHR